MTLRAKLIASATFWKEGLGTPSVPATVQGVSDTVIAGTAGNET